MRPRCLEDHFWPDIDSLSAKATPQPSHGALRGLRTRLKSRGRSRVARALRQASAWPTWAEVTTRLDGNAPAAITRAQRLSGSWPTRMQNRSSRRQRQLDATLNQDCSV